MTRQFKQQPVVDPSEVRPYEIYMLENDSYVYVGSAWKNTAVGREKMHRRGTGGAKALHDAINAGIDLVLRVVESGEGTCQDALDAEQRVLDVEIADKRKVLNLNIYPATQGYAKSPETKRKMREAAARRWSNPDQHEQASRNAVRSQNLPSVREAKRQRMLGSIPHSNFVYGMKGRKHTDESRIRHQDATRRRWTDDDQRQQLTESLIASWTSERRSHQSQVLKDQWIDPETRNRRVAAIKKGWETRRKNAAATTTTTDQE